MKGVKSTLLQSTTILVLAALASPAYGQVDEIVVTAQKREQSIRDVPISLQVVSGDDIKNQQISGAEDLADSMPNVFVSKDSVSNNIYVRGVGSGANAGYEQAVATFVDGVYHGRSRYSQSTLVDVERIEVLRGPQTIYFGNNAIGGAFSVTTKQPSLDQWEGYGLASYEFVGNEPAVEAAVGGPVIQDKLGIRVAGRYSHLQGYIKNTISGDKNPDVEDRFIRFSSLLKISDNWRASFKAEYGKQDSTAPFALQLIDCPPAAPFSPSTTFSCAYALATDQEADFDYRRASGPGERGDIEASEFLFKIERDNFDGPGIVAQASYSKQDFLLSADSDNVPAEFFSYNTLENLDQKTMEFRVTSPADSKLEWMVGAYYLDSDVRIDTTLNFPFSTVLLTGPLDVLAPYAPLSGDIQLDQQEKAFSAFGSLTFPFTERLSGTIGLRYTRSKKTGVQSATNATANDPFGFSVTPLPTALQPVAALLTGFNEHTTAATVKDDDFLPSISLRYEPIDDVSFYAKFSEGFKAGGFDAVELTGIPDRLSFAPETVKAYEIGMKSLLLDRTLSFNLSLFRSDYKDLQQSVAQFTATSAFITVTNVGALRTQGLEADMLWRPNDRFQLGGNIAILDAKYKDYPNGGCTVLQAYEATEAGETGCAQDLTGKSPPFAPNYSGNVKVGYNLPISNALKLSTDVMYSFSGAYDVIGDKDPRTRQGAWQKIDARLSLTDIDDTWSLSLIGKNLTNEKVLGSANDVVASAGSYSAQIMRGRTVAVQARFNF
ncbi:TonB-dependent receptor [Croceicoccus estronivorus]|uniref:TonB-dependent receptor n=1 Tax=Croceicoccus estronivorus TaxID=1172626 RepID=UPI000831E461|nr:TonB-dependent receptor [Croceicoccus estronivorus]OCC25631.1 TonB-dependent receptor [Croceicoccus estronivorus]